ncbi:MAG TPA: tape measure protein [Solirubrobacterales bacterium]
MGAFERAGKRVTPVLYGIGRATKTAALYAGGFAGAVGAFATYTGLKFNATMEQNTVAFTGFLGSTRKARKYLSELYAVAAKTPFEFPDLVSGARRFLAFGFAAKESKKILQEVGDTAAGLGGGAAEIERMVMALGQMKAKGRIQTEELMQLQELGIPTQDYLKKGLGLSNDQLQDELRRGAVTFDKGFKAIRAGMRRDFGGMSREQAKTFNGQLSTLKDNTVQMLGKLTKPIFNWLRSDVLPALNGALPGIQSWLKGAMEKLPGVFQSIKSGVQDFVAAIKPAQPLWENVLWPLLKGFGMGVAASIIGALKVAVPVLKGFMVVLGAVGKVMAPFKTLFQGLGLVLGFVFGGPILKAISASSKLGEGMNIVKGAAWLLAAPIRLVGRGFLFVSGTLLKLWLRFTPIGILLRKLPGALKMAGGAFGEFAGSALSAIKGAAGKIVGTITGLAPRMVAAGKSLWTSLARGFVAAVGSGLGFASDLGKAIANSAIGFLNDAIPNSIPVPLGPDISLPNDPIPHLANGGILRSAGRVLVGDAGPEVLSLPKGARVDPLPRLGAALAGAGGEGGADIVLHNYVELDGQVVTRTVERVARGRSNRR